MKTWLAQHARLGAGSLRRLALAPIATAFNVIVVAIAIALPAGLYVGLINIQQAVRKASPEPQLTVFLALDATRNDVREVDSRLKTNPQIARLRYVSRDQALQEMKRTTGMSGVIDALEGNPLPDAFVIDAADSSPSALQQLRAELKDLPKVEHVQLDAEWAQRLDAVLSAGRIALLLLATLLAFALVAITFNTIRLQILTQREEIEVATLIGATDAFIQRPFLYYGALLGLLGGITACALVWGAIVILNGALIDLAYLYGTHWAIDGLSLGDSVSLLLFAAALGWLGAGLSVNRHLAGVRPR